LAPTSLGDARGEEAEGRSAVGCAVRQRVRDERWPDDYKGVCLQKSQFSCWNQGDPNRKVLLLVARALLAARPQTALTTELVEETLWLSKGIISGVVCDRGGFGRANHYVTRDLWERNPPYWLNGRSPTCLVRNHAFFRL
jgi:hypothetical protein